MMQNLQPGGLPGKEERKNIFVAAFDKFGWIIAIGLMFFAAPESYAALEPYISSMITRHYSHDAAQIIAGFIWLLFFPAAFFLLRASISTTIGVAAVYAAQKLV